MLIARFDGEVDELKAAYDRAHAMVLSRVEARLGSASCGITAPSEATPFT